MLKRLNYVVFLLICTNFMSACSAFNFLDFGSSDDFTRADLEAFIGAPLPAGTVNLRYETEGGIDRIVIARFSAPADEIDAFVAALGFTEMPIAGGVTSSGPGISPPPDWWDAEALPATISLEQQIGSQHYQIVIEDSDGAMREVYLQSFTM